MARISYSGILEALVIGGDSGSGGGGEPGDCIMIDFEHRFLAIADSSKRNPALSRELLEDVSAVLDACMPGSVVNGPESLNEDALCTGLREGIERILQNIHGRGSSTLTGILMPGSREAGRVILIHTGDSSLISYGVSSGEIRYHTRRNFWLAGKSLKLFQVEAMSLPEDSWMVLVSDGFIDMMNSHGRSMEQFLLGLGDPSTVNGYIDRVLGLYSEVPLYDDAAMLLFRPELIVRSQERIIMGGTPRL